MNNSEKDFMRCPLCKSENTEAGEPWDAHSEHAHVKERPMECKDCGAEWDIHYHLEAREIYVTNDPEKGTEDLVLQQNLLKAARIIMLDKDEIETVRGTKNDRGIADMILEEVVRKIKITVEVNGGVAEITSCPQAVDVEIIDHDNEKHG